MKKKTETTNYSFFSHRECEYFPCHPGADPDNFNCLFCYCPLHSLGEACGGDFTYTADGLKDCSACLYPHDRNHYEQMIRRIPVYRKEESAGGNRK